MSHFFKAAGDASSYSKSVMSEFAKRVGIGTAAFALWFGGQLPAQETPRRAPASDAEVQRMKEIYLPSAAHDWLKRLEGTWHQEAEYGSGDSVVKAVGTVVNRIILGGRFVHSEGSTAQAGGPLAVESLLVFGFDGRTHDYTVLVLDTFGTYFVTAAGRGRSEQTVTMQGETLERGGAKKFSVVLTWIDRDTYRTEILFHFPGREPVAAVTALHRRRN